MKQKAITLVKHPFFSGSLIMIGGSMFANVINYVYHLIMGRLMGPEDYGTLASLYSVLYIVSVIPTSTSVAIVKFISSQKSTKEINILYSNIRKIYFKIALILSLVLGLLTPLIASFLNINDYFSVLMISAVLFLSLNTLVNQASLQGMLNFIGLVGPNIVSASIKFLLGVLLVYIGFSVVGAMFAVVLGVGLAYFLSSYLAKKRFKIIKNGKYDIKDFYQYSQPVLFQALSFTSLFTTDVLLVKHFLSPFDAGLYAALSILGKIIYFAAQPLTQVMFPIISGKKTKGEKYDHFFYLSFAATITLSVFVVLFYYFFPKLAIGIPYGQKYLSASSELVWMGIFVSVYSASYLLVNFMLSLNKTKIVIFPIIAAITQIVALMRWHSSILQIIQISLIISTLMFFSLMGSMVYYQQRRVYAKKN